MFNIIEDEKNRQRELNQIMENLHIRLRPETYKSKEETEEETVSSPNGEFDKLVQMGDDSGML